MIWLERKRLAERDAAELAGASLWTADLDERLRTKLIALLHQCARSPNALAERALSQLVRRLIEVEVGIRNAPDIGPVLQNSDTDMVLSYIDAVHLALTALQSSPVSGTYEHNYRPDEWSASINDLFNSYRVAFKFVDGMIIPLASEELHVAVVAPVVKLLHGRSDLAHVSDSYDNALKEIANNDAADAITDAGAALQKMLESLGCSGNALGPLIKDAKKRGLLAAHDGTLADGIEKFAHWASADRSEMGDAHGSSDAELDDAWLMVHVVGALILRLAGSPRGGSE